MSLLKRKNQRVAPRSLRRSPAHRKQSERQENSRKIRKPLYFQGPVRPGRSKCGSELAIGRVAYLLSSDVPERFTTAAAVDLRWPERRKCLSLAASPTSFRKNSRRHFLDSADLFLCPFSGTDTAILSPDTKLSILLPVVPRR